MVRAAQQFLCGVILIFLPAIRCAALLKIVGGVDSDVGRWPWQALVLDPINGTETAILCGGILVHRSWVLTASYCVRNPGVEVYFGVWNTTSSFEEGRRIHFAEKVVVHRCHSDNNNVFDYANLALIKLHKEEPTRNVVCFPTKPLDDWARLKGGVTIPHCVATGYGVTDSGHAAKVLQEVWFPYVSKKTCENTYGSWVGSDKVCTESKARDTCDGDMGGPLMCRAPSSNLCGGYYLAAVTIAGSSSCGVPGRPAVYTAIYPHIQWINHEIHKSSSNHPDVGARQTIVCPGSSSIKAEKIYENAPGFPFLESPRIAHGYWERVN